MSGENLERFKKYYLNEGKNELIEKMFLNMDESSSSEHNDSKMKTRRGQSLDRSGFILDNCGQYYKKPQWYEVPKKERKERSKLRRESNTECIEQENIRYSRSRQKNIQRQNASEFRQSSDSMTPDEQNTYHHHQSEEALNTKFHKSNDKQPKEMSKFQIGKRFLKGEIGIKSFNYYLIKEGLKSSKKTVTKSGTENVPKILGASKSEENIYEEIYFTDKPTPEHHKKQFHKNIIYPDCELCVQQCSSDNCDICKYNTIDNSCLDYNTSGSLKYQKTDENVKIINSRQGDYSVVNKLNKQPNVLQFQSYNPNNPGVYKIETTPVAFTSDYNPIQNINQQQIQFQPYTVNSFNPYVVNRKKSSSSSDSLHHQKNARRVQSEYFTCPPKNIYPNQPPDYIKPKIYKTDSRASLASEISIKSENSVKYHKTGEMSDSSIGDSMFSYPTQRRYFGSSESCRFGFECRRCSLETDKCSFSDTCRYECKNCDCSSSYFSSDFDDTNFNRKNSGTQFTTRLDARTTRYAEDFIKHVNNVKKNTLYHPDGLYHVNKSYEEFPTTHKNSKHQKHDSKILQKLENATKSPLKFNQEENFDLNIKMKNIQANSNNDSLEENQNLKKISQSLKMSSSENKESSLNRKKNKRTGTVPKSIVNDKLFKVKHELENVEGNSTGKINSIEPTELDAKVNCNLSENKILTVSNKLLDKKKISVWSDDENDEVFFDDMVVDTAVTVKKMVSFNLF